MIPVRHRRRPSGRQRLIHATKIVAASLTCCCLALVTSAGYFMMHTLGAVSSDAVDIGGEDDLPVVGLGGVEGDFDMLIVGTDNDADQGDAYGERDATLNDVNIWLHVSSDHSQVTAVSFPRDLIIPHPECTDPASGESYSAMSAQPLNVAFSRGGLACAATTISTLTGHPFDYAAAISFSGVIAMSTAVGGVEVCLADPIEDPDAGLSLPSGTSVIDGETALGFLRTRHGIGDGSDLARIANQQSFLSSLIRRVKSDQTISDPSRLAALAKVAGDHMKLSSSLANPLTMASLALTLKDVPLDRILFVQYPGTTGSLEFPGKVMPLEAEAASLIEAISSDQPFTLGADALGSGVGDAAPAQDAALEEPPAQPEEPATEPVETAPADAPPAPGDAVVEGVKGQTASQETCTQGFQE